MNILGQGKGTLLGWVDPDEHRAWVAKNKSRIMSDKRMTASDAVARFVSDGDFMIMGGFGTVRTAMSLLHEVIRQKKKKLAFHGKTGAHDLDLLIGGGCVNRVECAYSFGHEIRGLSPCSRRAVERGDVKVVSEMSNAVSQWRYLAGAMGTPFIPARNLLGTDTGHRSSAIFAEDPFSKKPVALIPSANPDVVLMHVPRCDKFGNAQIDGNIMEDFELARACRRLIISTEELVDTEIIRDSPWHTVIPYYLVDAVVVQKHGAHPTQMPLQYFYDEDIMGEWLNVSRTDEGVEQFMKKYIHDFKNYDEYLAFVGGEEKMQHLADIEHLVIPMKAPWAKKGKSGAMLEGGYTSTELLATVAASALENGQSVFVGTGLPMIAAMLAQRTTAPDLLLIFEAGSIGAQVPTLPISVGDSRTFHKAICASSMHDVMGICQSGYVDVAFLGAAQIDMHGNINTTMIGKDWFSPRTRLPGSGGGNDLASWCHNVVIIMRQDKTRFVKKVDFLTSPGYLDGEDQAREKVGLPANTGPAMVITQLATYDFDPHNHHRLRLRTLHPGVTLDDVRNNSSFDILIDKDETEVPLSPVPTPEVQRLIKELDPAGILSG